MKKHIKRLLYIFIFLIGILISYKRLETNKPIKTNNKYNSLILNYNFNNNTIFKDIKNLINYQEPKKDIKQDPIIYLYNTHQTEEYKSNNLFSINPNVTIVNYILKDIFIKNNYETIIEEQNIQEILNNNNWNYAGSYKASRTLLEQAKDKYNSLKYYIDIHRDSLEHSRTTITIDDKDYAKILFIIGLENDNYIKNKEFTEKINDKLNIYYPGLSKGILEKSGVGVNGVYNQDFDEKVILVEFGGYENTVSEILNTAIAFARCYLEVLNEEKN